MQGVMMRKPSDYTDEKVMRRDVDADADVSVFVFIVVLIIVKGSVYNFFCWQTKNSIRLLLS